MKIYFYDKNNRYIGNRDLLNGETIPENATTEPVITGDGEEAYSINGRWVINSIVEPA